MKAALKYYVTLRGDLKHRWHKIRKVDSQFRDMSINYPPSSPVYTGFSVDIFPGPLSCTQHYFVSTCAFQRHSASQAVYIGLSLDQ